MSIKITSWVWEHAPVAEGKLLVLLALADWADDEGYCHPKVPTLAHKARLSERQTIRVLHNLAKAGHIEVVERGNGRGKVARYRVLKKDDIGDTKGDKMSPFVGKKDDIGDTTKGDIGSIKDDIGDTKGDIGDESTYTRVDPSVDPLTDPSIKGTVRTRAAVSPPAVDPRPVFRLWQQNMPGTLTPILSKKIEELIAETGVAAVLDGIQVAVSKEVRNFNFVAGCARRTANGTGSPSDTRPAPKGRPPAYSGKANVAEAFAELSEMYADKDAS